MSVDSAHLQQLLLRHAGIAQSNLRGGGIWDTVKAATSAIGRFASNIPSFGAAAYDMARERLTQPSMAGAVRRGFSAAGSAAYQAVRQTGIASAPAAAWSAYKGVVEPVMKRSLPLLSGTSALPPLPPIARTPFFIGSGFARYV